MSDKKSWKDHGACNSAPDPDAWFPEPGADVRHSERTQAAIRTCAQCFVRFDCLLSALARDEVYGIWGGMTRKQRIRLVRETRERQAEHGDAA